MKTITVTAARATLYRLLEEAAESSEPTRITGKRGSAVLISERAWRAIQETLHLLSIPGMSESILEGGREPIESCAETLDW